MISMAIIYNTFQEVTDKLLARSVYRYATAMKMKANVEKFCVIGDQLKK